MNLNLKEAIMKRGLKQKYIAHAMNIDPVVFSKKLIGDLSFTKGEQAQISKLQEAHNKFRSREWGG
jgi:hypothetical protein